MGLAIGDESECWMLEVARREARSGRSSSSPSASAMAPMASSAVASDRALREATADAKPTAVMSASRVRCHGRSAEASGIAPRGDLLAGDGVRDRRRLPLLVVRNRTRRATGPGRSLPARLAAPWTMCPRRS